MSTTVEATYDGHVFRPIGPVVLEPNTSVRLTIDALPPGGESVGEDYPVADFYKPLEFTWTEQDYDVEKALKAFIEADHANR
jgi:hypothetical protein